MSATLTLALLVPSRPGIAAEWSRLSTANTPPAVNAIWKGALAEDRAAVLRNTGNPNRYIPPPIGWTRINTPRGPVIVTTIESKCEAPNSPTATDTMICSYVIASERQAFPPITVTGCYADNATDVRYDDMQHALELRIVGKGNVGAGCSASFPIPN
jgi:hypothetical protein